MKGDPKALTPRLLKRVELAAKQVLGAADDTSAAPLSSTKSEQDYIDIIKAQSGQLDKSQEQISKSQEQIDRLLSIIERFRTDI